MQVMRIISVILIVMLSVLNAVAAPPKKSYVTDAGCDSTSYMYYYSNPMINLFYWEGSVRVVKPLVIPEVTVSPIVDSLSALLRRDTVLFRLPATLPKLNNNYYTFEINETEYLVGIPSDNTSFMYGQKKRNVYSHNDSAMMYTPFELRNLRRYTYSFYGIDAWQIDAVDNAPERIHFDLSGEEVNLGLPSEILIPMVISLILILLANFFSSGYIPRLLLVIFYYNAFNNAAAERNISADKAGTLLFFNYIINVVVFAIIVLAKYEVSLPIGFLLALTAGCVSVGLVYLLKMLVSLLFSNLFLCRDTFSLHYTNVSYILQMLGVALLPVNFCMVYIGYEFPVSTLFIIGAVVCGLAELMKLMRLIKIIFDKHFSKFYLFLYLCGVEILPVLLAIKILSQ